MRKNGINGSGLAVIVAAVVVIAGLYSAVSQADYTDYALEVEHYCEMVRLWNLDTMNGIDSSERRGWPDFKDDGRCARD